MEFQSVRTVLPGDLVYVESEKDEIILGPGLMQNEESIICTKAGVLKRKENSWFIDSDQKRYIPATGENVVGRIIGKIGEVYRVDIGSAHQALLPFLAFDNATKKNRPNLNIGDLLYARISLANRDIDPEIDCKNPSTNKADVVYGELKKGFILKCSLRYCRRLFSLETKIIEILDKKLAQKNIETHIAIGLNGRIWFYTEKIKHAVVFYNVLKRAETMSDDEFLEIVKNLDLDG
ncbi:2741_t:CDS:2 [Diversispora eburnea]|uniref:Ribosomal RNA-processing protein 40 n=1 Tax=Diversispora eburnea TaxID=1213867 RepID=A0A9N9F1T4_9GLOM|nr:2741_t:CDS:2 [Diversispora eburnea]